LYYKKFVIIKFFRNFNFEFNLKELVSKPLTMYFYVFLIAYDEIFLKILKN